MMAIKFKEEIKKFLSSEIQTLIDAEDRVISIAKANDIERFKYSIKEIEEQKKANQNLYKVEIQLFILNKIEEYIPLNKRKKNKLHFIVQELMTNFINDIIDEKNVVRSYTEAEIIEIKKYWEQLSETYIQELSLRDTKPKIQRTRARLEKQREKLENLVMKANEQKALKDNEYHEKQVNAANEVRQIIREHQSQEITKSVASTLTLPIVERLKTSLANKKIIDVEEVYAQLSFGTKLVIYIASLFNAKTIAPIAKVPKATHSNQQDSTVKTTLMLDEHEKDHPTPSIKKEAELSNPKVSPLREKNYFVLNEQLLKSSRAMLTDIDKAYNETKFLNNLYKLHKAILNNIKANGGTGRTEDIAFAYKELFETGNPHMTRRFKNIESKLPTLIASFSNYERDLREKIPYLPAVHEKCRDLKNALFYLFPHIAKNVKENKSQVSSTSLDSAKKFLQRDLDESMRDIQLKQAYETRSLSL